MRSSGYFGSGLETLPHNPRLPQIPCFVRQAVRLIIRCGIDSEGIFRISGNKETVATFKESIDKGNDIDFVKEKANPYDVSSLLKQFLRELPDPLLTCQLYEKWIEAHGIGDRTVQLKVIKDLLDSLPESNRNMLAYLIPFFAIIAKNSRINKMDAGNLSKTVGPNMLWKAVSGDSIEYLVNSSKINDIIQVLIEESDYFFNPIDENIKFATLNAKLFGHQKSIQCLATGFQDEEIWSCDSNGDIRVWNTETGSFVREIDSKQGRLFTMSRISDTQICTASQKSLKIWDMEKHELIKEIAGFAYCAIGVGPSLWIGCENKIAVYSLSNFSQLQEIPVQNNVVMALCWDLKRKHVWGGTTDKRKPIFVWSTETNLMVQEIDISVGHKKKVNAFALAGDRMWSAGDDSSVCVWDCQNFMLLKRLEGHEGAVYGLAWFGDFVWSCGWDTTIRLWNTQTLCLSWEIRDVHNDCVSSIQSVWNIKKKHWQAWTSSWDKSICVFALSPEHHIPLKTQGNSLKVVDDASVDFQNNTDADSNGSVKDSEVIANSNGNNSEITKISSLNIMKGIKIQKKELEERRKQLEIKKAQLEMRRLELARKKEEVDHRIQIATVERGLLEPEYNSNYEDVQKEEK